MKVFPAFRRSVSSSSFLNFSVRVLVLASIFLVSVNIARAQHCPDGCTVNINGPTYVRVGDTATYTVMPSAPYISYNAQWDDLGFMPGYADVIDQGINGSGEEYITLRFTNTGYPWFTYLGSYSCCHGQDFDEMSIWIAP